MEKWTFDSTSISAIKYFPEIQILIIFFVSGTVYEYYPISPELYQEFRDAPSPGTFYHQRIKGNPDFTGRKIDDVSE